MLEVPKTPEELKLELEAKAKQEAQEEEAKLKAEAIKKALEEEAKAKAEAKEKLDALIKKYFPCMSWIRGSDGEPGGI